jgi:hypothetical protein
MSQFLGYFFMKLAILAVLAEREQGRTQLFGYFFMKLAILTVLAEGGRG